jgi:hypothetical protein
MKLERFAQCAKSFFFRTALARKIDVQTLRDVQLAFLPHGRLELPH